MRQEEWEIIDNISAPVKTQILEEYTAEIIKNLEEKDKKEKGYWEKLISKIVDNIQISIK